MVPTLARHAPQTSRPTMTSTTLAPTSQVLEFNCIYTHDILRKNQKRWHDGRLSFHTFNKRVMVYDLSRNSIGDTYAREFDTLNDGDEIRLDRPVLVQVCEAIGSKTQDLTGVIGTRENGSSSEAARGSTYKPAIMPENAAAPSLKQVLGASKRVGRAHLLKSAYDQRQETFAQQNAAVQDTERPAETPRPAKRQRKNESQPTPSKQTPGRSPVPLAGGRPPLRVIKQAREIERAAALKDYSSTKHTYTGPERNPPIVDPASILISSSPLEVIESLTPIDTRNNSEPVQISKTKTKKRRANMTADLEPAATESQKRKAKLKIGANTSKKRMMFGDLLAEASSKKSRSREESEAIMQAELTVETDPSTEAVSIQVEKPASIDAPKLPLPDTDEQGNIPPADIQERQPVRHSPSPTENQITTGVSSQDHSQEEKILPEEQEHLDPQEDILIDNQAWKGFSQIPSQTEPELGLVAELETINPIDEITESIQVGHELPALDLNAAERLSSPTPPAQSLASIDSFPQDTNILVPSTPPSQSLEQLSITDDIAPEVAAAIEQNKPDELVRLVEPPQDSEPSPPSPIDGNKTDGPTLPVQSPPVQSPPEPSPLLPQPSEVPLPSTAPSKKPYRKKPLLNRDPPKPAPPDPGPAKIPSSSPAFETQLSPRTRRQQREQAQEQADPPAPATTTDETQKPAPKPMPVPTARTITRKSKVVSLLKNSKPKAPITTKRKAKDNDDVIYTFRPPASGPSAWSASEAWDLFGWVPGTARCVSETEKLRR